MKMGNETPLEGLESLRHNAKVTNTVRDDVLREIQLNSYQHMRSHHLKHLS
jgi:hypothetical protein